MTTRGAIPLTGAIAALALVTGCGGGGGGTTASTGTTAAPATPSPAATKAQIRRAWTAFFDGSTPAAERVRLLTNGSRYRKAIQAQSSSSIASQTKAKVGAIQLRGPTQAKVTYTILVAGQPLLRNRTGTAVKAGGAWKVSDRSFCQLLGLQGTVPSACSGG